MFNSACLLCEAVVQMSPTVAAAQRSPFHFRMTPICATHKLPVYTVFHGLDVGSNGQKHGIKSYLFRGLKAWLCLRRRIAVINHA